MDRRHPQTKQKKGRLVVMFDVVRRGNEPRMKLTGLEPLMAEYGVRVKNELILTLNLVPLGQEPAPPTFLVVGVNVRQPIGKALAGYKFFLLEARPVEPLENARSFKAERLLEVSPQLGIWLTEDLSKPGQQWREMMSLMQKQDPAAFARISRVPVSVAVAVTETTPPVPQMTPDKPPAPEPRLVVFGDATWATNDILREPGIGGSSPELMTNTLDWLHGRETLGPSPDDAGRSQPEYTLQLQTEKGKDYFWTIIWLPGTLLLLAVIAAGLGVWVVRRR
jgi:hypothetical protein